MTQAVSPAPNQSLSIQPSLHYTVSMSQPATHLFEVSLTVENWTEPVLDLKFPVWTPGSYLVREYAKHLQEFAAADAQGHPLSWQKCRKNHWQVDTKTVQSITVSYRIYAHELTVRTNHLDVSHGYFNPAALVFRIPGYEQQAIAITIVPPHPDWRVTTPLPAAPDARNIYVAQSFDELVDSPFEIGTHDCHDFNVLGIPHQFAIWGKGNLDVPRLIADTTRIIETEAQIFGGLPYSRYLFLLHLTGNGYGGLEHRTCCSLIFSRFRFRDADSYHRFMSLVAHEFFHLWNVKRIRPKALETFDYDQESYIDTLGFCEGMTSYYDLMIPWRAGIYEAKTFLKFLSESVTRFLTTPGRQVQSLSESSLDAWIKLYRPDANSKNSQISYYLKGELVSFLLELLIRRQHQNQRSLDAVMQQMWQQFGQPEIGFTSEQLRGVFEAVAETDLTAFWQDYIDGTRELPFNEFLEPFGLAVVADTQTADTPYLGLTLTAEQGAAIIQFVATDSPAQVAGLEPGDELLALDGFRIKADQGSEALASTLAGRLKDYVPGETLEIAVFHGDVLQVCHATLTEPIATKYSIQPLDQPSPEQQALAQGWLGVPLAALQSKSSSSS